MPQPGLGVTLWVFDHARNLTRVSSDPTATGGAANLVEPLPTTALADYIADIPDVANVNWLIVGELTDLNLSGPDAAVVDMSSLNSFMKYKNYKRGRKDPGSLSATVLYNDGYLPRTLQLFQDYGGGSGCIGAAVRWFQVRVPAEDCDSDLSFLWTSQGFLKSAPLKVSGADDPITMEIEIQLVGPPVLIDDDDPPTVYYPISA